MKRQTRLIHSFGPWIANLRNTFAPGCNCYTTVGCSSGVARAKSESGSPAHPSSAIHRNSTNRRAEMPHGNHSLQLILIISLYLTRVFSIQGKYKKAFILIQKRKADFLQYCLWWSFGLWCRVNFLIYVNFLGGYQNLRGNIASLKTDVTTQKTTINIFTASNLLSVLNFMERHCSHFCKYYDFCLRFCFMQLITKFYFYSTVKSTKPYQLFWQVFW